MTEEERKVAVEKQVACLQLLFQLIPEVSISFTFLSTFFYDASSSTGRICYLDLYVGGENKDCRWIIAEVLLFIIYFTSKRLGKK